MQNILENPVIEKAARSIALSAACFSLTSCDVPPRVREAFAPISDGPLAVTRRNGHATSVKIYVEESFAKYATLQVFSSNGKEAVYHSRIPPNTFQESYLGPINEQVFAGLCVRYSKSHMITVAICNTNGVNVDSTSVTELTASRPFSRSQEHTMKTHAGRILVQGVDHPRSRLHLADYHVKDAAKLTNSFSGWDNINYVQVIGKGPDGSPVIYGVNVGDAKLPAKL